MSTNILVALTMIAGPMGGVILGWIVGAWIAFADTKCQFRRRLFVGTLSALLWGAFILVAIGVAQGGHR